MDYTARYGLEFNPFLKNSKEVLVETQEYKEVLFRLNYLLTTKGFGLLTGSAGRGKTTAVRNWASGLNTSLYKVVYSSLSTLTVNDFYRNLAAELGAQPAFRKTDNFKIIQGEINRLVLEKRQTPVIIIDEANYIGNAVLNDLKMLFNFEMDSKDRAVVLLSGLPQLNSTLRLSIHEPFRQRIVMNYNLEGMTKAEGHSYVAAKLNGAGCTQTVFEDNALEAILNAANGTPRMINKLCNASLLVGNSSNLNIITADAVMQAINDCEALHFQTILRKIILHLLYRIGIFKIRHFLHGFRKVLLTLGIHEKSTFHKVHINTNAPVIDFFIQVILIPNLIRNRKSCEFLLYPHFRFHISQIVCFKTVPFFHIMHWKISGTSAICFCGRTRNTEILNQILSFRQFLLLQAQNSTNTFQR